MGNSPGDWFVGLCYEPLLSKTTREASQTSAREKVAYFSAVVKHPIDTVQYSTLYRRVATPKLSIRTIARPLEL